MPGGRSATADVASVIEQAERDDRHGTQAKWEGILKAIQMNVTAGTVASYSFK